MHFGLRISDFGLPDRKATGSRQPATGEANNRRSLLASCLLPVACCLLFICAICVICGSSGCTAVTQDQKDWIRDKANRSAAFVALMDEGRTSRAQEQDWIRSQDESWRLWSQKVDLGLAAPNWMADATKQASSQPAATQPATQPAGGAK